MKNLPLDLSGRKLICLLRNRRRKRFLKKNPKAPNLNQSKLSSHQLKYLVTPITPEGKVVNLSTQPITEEGGSSQTTPKVDRGKGITRDINESPSKLVLAYKEVRQDPDAPVLITYETNGRMYQLTNEQIQACLAIKEQLEKATREARLMQLSKLELIKVVIKVATKVGVDPKALQSSKGGKEFLMQYDADLEVHQREHLAKVKKSNKLRKKDTINIYGLLPTN
nr:hypothetical protein [Tanacetum cinerariifolium]